MTTEDEMRKKVYDENTLLLAVTELCRELGLLYHHCNDSRLCNARPGMPDLIIVSKDGNGVLFAELKGHSGKGAYLSASQQTWRWALIANQEAWRLWRPYDWHDESIQHELLMIS